jgi:hypothetical protein
MSGSLQDRMWALEVKVLCERGKSAVGAEISGPALPRFTSGVGSCEDAQGGCFARTTAQEASVQFRRILLDLLVWPWRQCLHILYPPRCAPLGCTIAILAAAQAPRHSMSKLALTQGKSRPPGSAILHPPSGDAVSASPLCTTCFWRYARGS